MPISFIATFVFGMIGVILSLASDYLDDEKKKIGKRIAQVFLLTGFCFCVYFLLLGFGYIR